MRKSILCAFMLCLMGCGSSGDGDGQAAAQVSALSESQYDSFCDDSVGVLGKVFEDSGASDGVIGCDDGTSGLEVSSAAGCKNAPAPDCMRQDVDACIDAMAEDPCALHTASECEAFVSCASDDGSVEGLDYLIRYLAEPPANGPGHAAF